MFARTHGIVFLLIHSKALKPRFFTIHTEGNIFVGYVGKTVLCNYKLKYIIWVFTLIK